MEEFVHTYEMESLELGITARKDVVAQMAAVLPRSDDGSGLGGAFTATAQALAARRAGAKQQKEQQVTATLVLAGNSRESFHNRLRNIQLVALVNALLKSNVAVLTAVDLRYNHLGEQQETKHDEPSDDEEETHSRDEREFLLDAASSLGRLLQPTASYPCAIAELNLRGNRLGSESCRVLCTALEAAGTASPLRRLDLNSNPLGSAGGHAIAELLGSSTCRLQHLDLGNTELDATNLVAISQALRANKLLETLNLDNPVVRSKEEEAVQHVGKMLQVNRTLTSLSLSKHQLTDNGAQVLAERLLDNRSLRRLVLRANRIGSTGASALAALLMRHPTLCEFDLSANRIGDVGARAFAQVLRANTATPLRVLALCSTSLTDEGVAALLAACLRPQHAEDGSQLQSLLLWGNVFGAKAAPLAMELCGESGRFQQCDVETDFLPRQVDDEVHVALQDVHRARSFASAKR